MVASLPEALQKALAEQEARAQAQAHNLSQVVGEWSADDHVHIDPPLRTQPPTNPPQETKVSDDHFLGQSASTGQAPAHPSHFKPTNNVTKTTFEYIRDNPHVKRSDAIKALAAQGFNPGSVSSLIGQMVLQHIFYQDDAGQLSTNMREYVPLKSGAVRKLLSQARQKELRRSGRIKKAEGIRKISKARTATAKAKRERVATNTARGAAGRAAANAARTENAQQAALLAKEERRREADRIRHAARRAAMKEAQTGVNIDTAHKTAKPVMHVKKPIVDVVADWSATHAHPNAQATSVDLRSLSAEAIVEAMNIKQATAVYKVLFEVFGAM